MDPNQRSRPIYSALAEDPAANESVDAFVVVLAERVDELQDVELHGKLGELARLAQTLAAASTAAGYPELCASARAVETACDDRSRDAVRKALEELTEVAQRVRQGHRGAV